MAEEIVKEIEGKPVRLVAHIYVGPQDEVYLKSCLVPNNPEMLLEFLDCCSRFVRGKVARPDLQSERLIDKLLKQGIIKRKEKDNGSIGS